MGWWWSSSNLDVELQAIADWLEAIENSQVTLLKGMKAMSQNVTDLTAQVTAVSGIMSQLLAAVDTLISQTDPTDAAAIQAATANLKTVYDNAQAELAKLNPPAPPAP